MLEDMLQETVIYQYILQQGVAKGEQQGLEKGIEKGFQQELQDLRRLLLSSVRSKFPALVPVTNKRIAEVESVEVLMDLTLKVFASQTVGEFYKALTLLNERER